MLFRSSLLLALLLVLPLVSQASAQPLKPFKDELFAYPGIISSEAGGAYLVVEYSEARDINERDQVPEGRVRAKYVSTGVRKVQQDLVLKADAGTTVAKRRFAICSFGWLAWIASCRSARFQRSSITARSTRASVLIRL